MFLIKHLMHIKELIEILYLYPKGFEFLILYNYIISIHLARFAREFERTAIGNILITKTPIRNIVSSKL